MNGPHHRPFLRCAAATLLIGVATGCHEGADHRPAPGDEPSQGPYLLVLGTAQDGGLPHAACDCARCVKAREDPSKRRRIASLALVLPENPARVYLIDVTPDIRGQWSEHLRPITGGGGARVDRDPVDGVFLTHAHLGHYTGLAFFGFEAIHTRGLEVYCTPRMGRFLADNGPWSQLVGLGNIAILERPPGTVVTLGGGVTVASFAVPHRDELSDTVGYLISGPRRSVVYVPDTDGWTHWQPALEQRLAGVDLALLDGTFFSADELPGRDVASIGHPLITATMERLLPAVGGGKLEVFFTHLNHSNPLLDEKSDQRKLLESRGFKVLEDGAVLQL